MIKNALFLFFVCAAIFAFYLPAYLRMQALSDKNVAYQARIYQLERENQKLGDEREKLKSDPAYFEKVAREKMGIIKEDEVIYKMVPVGSKKAGEPNSDDERAIMKKPVGEVKKKAAAPVVKKTVSGTKKTVVTFKSPAVVVKKTAPVAQKTTVVQKKTEGVKNSSPKKKTSATMSKSKTGKIEPKPSPTAIKTTIKSN